MQNDKVLKKTFDPTQKADGMARIAKSILTTMYQINPKHELFAKNKNLSAIIRALSEERATKIAAFKAAQEKKK